MTTKEKIVEVSLELFSTRGFSGVSVRDIAKAVGVRESALYKHYKNKQDILDTIILQMHEKIHTAYVKNQVPEAIRPDVSAGYQELSGEGICEIAWGLFELYTKDPEISRYRKLLMREMMTNDAISALYSETFLTGVLERQGKTFEKLVEGKFFRKENSRIMALQFYGPIFLLFQEYDCHPEREEQLKQMLYEHVKVFGRSFENAETTCK